MRRTKERNSIKRCMTHTFVWTRQTGYISTGFHWVSPSSLFLSVSLFLCLSLCLLFLLPSPSRMSGASSSLSIAPSFVSVLESMTDPLQTKVYVVFIASLLSMKSEIRMKIFLFPSIDLYGLGSYLFLLLASVVLSFE